MANEKLIYADALLAKFERIAKKSAYPYFHLDEIADEINEADAVDAYTVEQVASITQQADKLEVRNQELEKECAWLKSCLNCKKRKECQRHCGKVVHNCDHWEHGDSTVDAVEVVHGRWLPSESMVLSSRCSVCRSWVVKHAITNPNYKYCPHCGAKMDGGNEYANTD